MDEFIRKAKLEQQSSLDEEWVDSQVVCQYLRICDKTVQCLRSAGKITYSTIGNKYYYQIAEIKRCLRAHTIKSSEEMLQNLNKLFCVSILNPKHINTTKGCPTELWVALLFAMAQASG